MPDRRDRDNELRDEGRVATLENQVKELQVDNGENRERIEQVQMYIEGNKNDIRQILKGIDANNARWEKQDSQVLKWLFRAIVVLIISTLTGGNEVIMKKVEKIMPWLGQ